MTRLMIVLSVALALGVHAVTLAQTRPDFTGTWRYNQSKSNPNTSGNTPNIAFPSQIVVKQTPTEISVDSTSVRQQPVSAIGRKPKRCGVTRSVLIPPPPGQRFNSPGS